MADIKNLITVNDDDFSIKVLQSATPVLVDFWAPWCGPCKAIAPILEDLATSYEDRLIIAKVNVDTNSKYMSEYGVRSIPTLILFKNGEKLDQKVGSLSKGQLIIFLDQYLNTEKSKDEKATMEGNKATNSL